MSPQIAALVVLFVTITLLAFVAATAARRIGPKVSALVALSLGVLYAGVLITRPAPVIAGGIVGGVAAIAIGAWLGSAVLPNLPGLVTFLLTASVLDVMSVRGGPTRALFDAAGSDGGFVYYLVVLLPWQDGFIPVVGVSDLFGLAVILACLLAMGCQRWLALACGLSAMLFAFAAGLLLGGVPAYPLLAAFAVPVAVWTHRRRAADRGSAK